MAPNQIADIKIIVNRLILGLALSLPILLSAQSALEIVEPADASVIRPGETVVVIARTGGGYTYFFLDGDSALKTSQAREGPRFRFSVQIPSDINAGLYRI